MNPQMTPPSTPDPVPADAAHDALDVLLRQIVGGYFVLTDGQGVVSKWSEPAELLFGRPSEDVLGQGFFATLIGAPLSPAAQTWRGFLDRGEPPVAPGTVQIAGRHADGSEFPLEAVFVPVKLDEGFDFSRFLEDLAFDLPVNLMLLRMRRQHPVVVRALRHGIEPRPQPWEDRRTAGTLVVFKPLAPTPWVQAELARRDAERAAADGEAEQRLTNTDPGIQGGVADLDDAAAVVARLLSAMERIEDLERLTGGLPAQLEAARRDADALRGDVRRALSEVPSRFDARHDARLAAASTTGAVARSALAPLREAVAHLQDGSAELRRRLDAEDLSALRERIDGVVAREEPAALRAEEALSLAREALRRVEEVDRGAGTVLADVRAADHRVAALRTELVEVRDVAEAAGRGVDALRGELAGLREIAEAARAEAAAAVRAGEERAEAMQSDLAFALAHLEELKQGLSSAGQAAAMARREAEQARKAAENAGDGSQERVTEVFQQILGMAAVRTSRGSEAPAPSAAPKPEDVRREARHGFDDVDRPLAVLGLDGQFKELNPAFTRLVGYKEHEFVKAAWPSPHDRRDYKDQLTQLGTLATGEVRAIAVQSTYMHGQGLMVPVIGTLSVAAGEDGKPSHLVLEAEDRHRA